MAGWEDLYGREREKYNRNGWGVVVDSMVRVERNMIKELKSRDKDTQKQWEKSRIREDRTIGSIRI